MAAQHDPNANGLIYKITSKLTLLTLLMPYNSHHQTCHLYHCVTAKSRHCKT